LELQACLSLLRSEIKAVIPVPTPSSIRIITGPDVIYSHVSITGEALWKWWGVNMTIQNFGKYKKA